MKMLRLITLLALLAAIAQAKIRIPDLPHSLREREEFRFGVVEDDSKIVGGEEVDEPGGSKEILLTPYDDAALLSFPTIHKVSS